jgi:hypothetical protein
MTTDVELQHLMYISSSAWAWSFLGASCLLTPALLRLFESLFQILIGDIHTGVRLPE